MADGRTAKSARPRQANPPPRSLTAGEFAATREFAHFKAVMRRLVAVPKVEVDAMVKATREKSPRVDNPAAPGRKRCNRRSHGR